MPSGNDSSQRIEADGASPPEPLVDRQQLVLDVLRQDIARLAETRKGGMSS